MNTVFNKAVAAFIGALATMLGFAHIEMPSFLMDPTVQATISAIIVSAVTYFVPNKKEEGPAPPLLPGPPLDLSGGKF